MKATIFTIMLSIALLATSQAWAWDWYPLGGGNAEKIVISEVPPGVWCFEKDGGAFWLPYDPNSQDPWGPWQGFDANYCWHMGGDVLRIGPALTPYALNATMQEHHLYKWYGDSWEYEDRLENDYYQYHDAQFFASNNGTTNIQWFLVSTWQLWDGDQTSTTTYRRGIYLISDGQAPLAEDPDALIDGTEDLTYPKIHRDVWDKQVFYTWHGPEAEFAFQRIDVIEPFPGQFDASMSDDFDETLNHYTLKDVAQGGFYQYVYDEVYHLVHQYLLAMTENTGRTYWDVWHRQGPGGSLGASDWSIIWHDVKGALSGATPQGLAARMNGLFEHDICIFTQDNRLALYNTASETFMMESFAADNPEAFIAFLSFCFDRPSPQVAGSPLNSAVPCTQLR